ncbi:hypothetical protein TDB9533_04454 [Thalassocella blandensis]|nr:hypothetical protein TDB9533_04454 [Thalassocella blandensis]
MPDNTADQKKLLVLNVVGLSPKHIGKHTPHLQALAQQGELAPIQSMLPAVTSSVQATYFTGTTPAQHGIVGNGWFYPDICEIKFWHQSNKLVQQPQIWSALKKQNPQATSANMFCWFNMYCDADTAVTVRPMYPADGRKLPDIYTSPMHLRPELNKKLGMFPLFNFWGPKSSIVSSQWIADSTMEIMTQQQPDLCVAYLPHLDYPLQKVGPSHASIETELQQIDDVCGQLIRKAAELNYQVVVLSEYGIFEVDKPCHLNRLFREKNWIALREELGLELLDAGASQVFAVADHQVAHVHVQNPALIDEVAAVLQAQEAIDLILDKSAQKSYGLDHERSGDFVVIAKPDSWFTYYYWLDDAKAPDFARTVEIHRKPGYDPVELFIDPQIKFPMLKVIKKLIQKKLGFRTLMDVIPLDASLVKGSHGAIAPTLEDGPVFITNCHDCVSEQQQQEGIAPTQVMSMLLRQLQP